VGAVLSRGHRKRGSNAGVVTVSAISIVLPTRDGMASLPAVMDALERQQTDCPVEIVAIDTASSDGTPELLRGRGARLIEIAEGEFNHGLTRNRAIAEARGELVVILSQDAEPADDQWLMKLVSPFRHNPSLAGSFARQQPRPAAAAIARHYHAGWVGSARYGRVASVGSRTAFEGMSALDRMRLCTFDNVCSCIRRDVWRTHPFNDTPIAEDLEWAREVLLAGYQIAYVPGSVVIHSHERSAWYEFRRTALLHMRLRDLFGVRTIPSVPALARAVASTTRLHLECRRKAPSGQRTESLAQALALAIAWPAGQYIGGRLSDRRRRYVPGPEV
jgi:rhamnosyltransferase